jgi:poly-gamma-glutamate capsule biosynthesis protein CapA/YwtB (metallophosphatase superfamily)
MARQDRRATGPGLRGRVAALAFLAAVGLVLAGGRVPDPGGRDEGRAETPQGAPVGEGRAVQPERGQDRPPSTRGTVTLAFAGDVHFQLQLAALLEQPQGALGPVSRTLADADVAMVNLESAITERGTPEAKEREVPEARYHFRTTPAALDVLAAAGVDVVTMANNHGADYGPVGLQDTLEAVEEGPVPVVGIGRDRRTALAPHVVSVRGTTIAFLGADQSMREGRSSVWVAGPSNPGVAAARSAQPRALLAAVRAASGRADVVVVYLHWGEEYQSCPNPLQRETARALADAGADVVVGAHAHVLLGAGWLDDTYVSYGLGNFVWYHDRRPDTGVLRVRIRDGEVVGGSLAPARIQPGGVPRPLTGRARAEAVTAWASLRDCTDLAAAPDR